HHGRNPQYIDKNYAGIFIVWDKFFGTFAAETETVVYGITKPVNSVNPLRVTFREWQDMLTEACARGLSFKQRLRILFAPPAPSVNTDELPR
ncbi:MAG: sterol desaturase family protein, partial [Shewanella sp.]